MFYCYLFLKYPQVFYFSSEILCCVSGYQMKAYNINFIYLSIIEK